MRVAVEFNWRQVGWLRVEAGRLSFPDLPDVPGVYRFDLGERIYIGEADRLRRRFQHYRTPGPRQATNLRLNALMLELLGASTAIEVSTVTAAEKSTAGRHRSTSVTSRRDCWSRTRRSRLLVWLANRSRTFDGGR